MDAPYRIEMEGGERKQNESPGSSAGKTPQELIACLEEKSDETLRDLIGRAKALLAARKNERQDRALAAIRQLAREHGIVVQASRQGRKRGRPRKARDGA